MRNETYLDFCFIREGTGNFSQEINLIFTEIFNGKRLYWYLDEKNQDGLEIVVAEVKGMSDWNSEEDLLHHLEEHGGNPFWNYIQGYQFVIHPDMKGCKSCETH
ncbi:hypothetical protein [Metabacillus halosaccharovorans]|uniref:hypothetical protein n=1 Tax=Metabacillus halosaccharovorans TaxID=930124 RepID=UPI001C1F2087|nr:hypothetical protein [Metabacillus halosaccharovorans]MBU7595555.1 hypothetical protein [Metabacillus halosaccharovorans]